MAPILFLFVVQAVMETLEQTLLTIKPEYRYIANNKGCLTGQRTASNGTPFQLNNLLFVDDGAFIFQNWSDIKTGTQTIYFHFEHFCLQIHVVTDDTKLKMEAMFFPPSLIEANESSSTELPKDLKLNNNANSIPFTNKFKYLGAFITPELNEDVKIKTCINKAKAQMRLLRCFLSTKDVDWRVKKKYTWQDPLTLSSGAVNHGMLQKES